MEIRIPFAAFKGKGRKRGREFGFDIGVDDQDYSQEPRKALIVWTGDENNHMNPSLFGRLVLTRP